MLPVLFPTLFWLRVCDAACMNCTSKHQAMCEVLLQNDTHLTA
jgi:hypothetical protein